MTTASRARVDGWQRLFITTLIALSFAAPSTVFADPPPWAPAHGYHQRHETKHKHKHKKHKHKKHKHKKHKHGHDVYVDEVYGYDMPELGIPDGRCNSEAVGAVLGGVVGGVVGSRVGKGDGKTIATIAGTVLGIFVGSRMGRSMDDADRFCTGQALEQASDHQRVVWRNPDRDTEYEVTPVATYKQDERYCREYQTKVTIGGDPRNLYGTACRTRDGSWEIQ